MSDFDSASSDFEEAFHDLKKIAKARIDRRWPDKIVANLSGETLDAFIYQNVVASRFVMSFKVQGLGLLIIRDFNDQTIAARKAVSAVNFPFYSELIIPAAPDGYFPLDWFDEGAGPPVMSDNPKWADGGWKGAELLLMPQMLDFDAVTAKDFGALGPLFWLPKQMQEWAKETLLEKGVAEEKWFAVVDLQDDDLVDSVVDATKRLGGQVVSLSPNAERQQGVIPLPLAEEYFEIRMAAIALARFFIGRDHYHTTLASAFAVPCTMMEGKNYERRVWSRGDIVATGKVAPEMIGKLIALFDKRTEAKPILSPQTANYQRDDLEAIPLVWPKTKPVVSFWE